MKSLEMIKIRDCGMMDPKLGMRGFDHISSHSKLSSCDVDLRVTESKDRFFHIKYLDGDENAPQSRSVPSQSLNRLGEGGSVAKRS